MVFDHFPHRVKAWARTASRPIVIVAAAVLALGAVGGTPQAGAARTTPPLYYNLYAGAAKFNVDGRTWRISPSYLGEPQVVEIELSTANETDDWQASFAPAADLVVNSSTDAATFRTHNTLAPLAFIDLKFSPTSRKTVTCETGSATDVTGTLTGTLSLTANHRGLKFKSSRVSMPKSTLEIDYSCIPPPVETECELGFYEFGSKYFGTGAAPGLALPGRHTYVAGVESDQAVTAPAHTVFLLGVYQDSAAPVFNSKTRQLSIKVTGKGPVTGSAVVTSKGTPETEAVPCTLDGKQYTQDQTSYSGTYDSPKGHQYEAHSLVIGEVKVPRTGDGFFYITRLKAA